MNVPKGYTAEELERDNPYNQWMYEDRDPDFEEKDEEEEEICTSCNGSGEGQHDGTRCSCCKGRGVK